jgi:hypothetical protein
MTIKELREQLQDLEDQGYAEAPVVQQNDSGTWSEFDSLALMQGWWYGPDGDEFGVGERSESLFAVHNRVAVEGLAILGVMHSR